MDTVIVKGILNEDGKIIVDLPPGWKAGEIEIEIPVEATWTDEELKEALRFEAKTLGEILASGLVGAGADWNIGDSAEWVEEQRRKPREKRNQDWTD